MGLKVEATGESGNVCGVAVRAEGPDPEVAFAIEPRMDLEHLWFHFSISRVNPEAAPPAPALRLLLKHTDCITAIDRAAALLPVWRAADRAWTRLLPGREEVLPDGQRGIIWELDYPRQAIEVAMCYPYGAEELQPLLSKSRGYWIDTAIGVTAEGRRLTRLFNNPGASGRRAPGIYLIARQVAGETPASWALDGLLQQISSTRKTPFLVWALPFVNYDGVVAGDSGRNSMPWAFEQSWGSAARRHESMIVQQDIARWKGRCQPRLALDFRAAPLCGIDGIRMRLPDATAFPELHKAAARWAEIAREMLGPELAAAEFLIQQQPETELWPGGRGFAEFMAADMSVPTVMIETPYTFAGGNVLTIKKYREAGRILADSILKRL